MKSFSLVLVMMLSSVTLLQGLDLFDDAISNIIREVYKRQRHPGRESPTNDRGVVKSCGKTNFSLSWAPKVIDPLHALTVFYDYTIPYNFKEGSLRAMLFLGDDKEPDIDTTLPVDCDHIKKYMTCPLKAGVRLHGTYKMRNVFILRGYAGKYRVELHLMNDKQQELFCARANVTIT